jgi:hypothetical protein
MRTVLMVIVCAGAVFGTGAAAQAQAPAQPLSAPGFTTQFPGDWKHVQNKRRGVTFHTLMAPGTTVPNIWRSIPRAGGVAITISTRTAANYRADVGRAAPRSGIAMLRAVGIPRAAKNVKVVTKGARFKLDGRTGATVAATYTYNGTENLQRDVAVRKGNRIVLIELNCRPDLEPAGQGALNVVLAGWHWS